MLMSTSSRPSDAAASCDQPLALRAARQVGLDERRPGRPAARTASAASSASALRSVVGERDIHPAAREIERDGRADALAAGDERGAIAELHVADR